MYIFASICTTVAVMFLLYLWVSGGDSADASYNSAYAVIFWMIECVGLIPLVLTIYEIAKGFAGAKYSVDGDGMTTYLGKRIWHLAWSDISDYGIVKAKISVSTSVAFVYCTTVPLTVKEKKNFLKDRGKSFDTTMYFQVCDREGVDEFLQYVPDVDRARILYSLRQYSELFQDE
jgi:hypothetical protein